MIPLYVPMLKARKGEFDALSHLSVNCQKSIVPLLDIPKPKAGHNTMLHLASVAEAVSKCWTHKEIFIDLFHWDSFARTELGEHVLLTAWKLLEAENLIVNPVVGYDRWEDQEYVLAIKNILSITDRPICIRFDLDAIREPDLMIDLLKSIKTELHLNLQDVYVLLDLEDMTHISVNSVLSYLSEAVLTLKANGVSKVIVSGSSMPESITFIPNENSSGIVTRKESIIWKTLFTEEGGLPVIYGDYGIRNPKVRDGIINPNINGKIRYTIPNQYYVLRGHSMTKPPKGKQTHGLSQALVNTTYYRGANYSWGDAQIELCSQTMITGNSTTWIGIDTNHHIEFVLEEIVAFQKAFVSNKVVIKQGS